MSKILLLLFSLLFIANAKGQEHFAPVLGDRTLSYPRDHGAHREFGTEWWYLTGHLSAQDETRYGFELVFFRVGLQAKSVSRSAWKADSLYLAHFAFTDDRKQTFRNFERRSRGNFGQAGASDTGLDVWLQDWKLVERSGKIELSAAADNISLSLELDPKKPLVLHGLNGFSKKGPEQGNASYYSSYTRLLGSGTLVIDGLSRTIAKASAWLDQEFTSSSLARGDQGWDWFALQLENGEELMLYQLRDTAGKPTVFSSGTFVRRDGSSVHLTNNEFSVEVLEHSKSKKSGVLYPARWRLRVPALEFEAELRPTVSDQELQTGASTGVTYWEGRTLFSGHERTEKISGAAYVELVGYEQKAHSQE